MTNTDAPPGPPTEALEAFAGVIGAEHLDTDADTLRLAETATFATRQRVVAVAQPADRAEVQACVRLANRFSVPIYPVSQGKNWGYGSRVPVADGSVILSLQRLRGIVDYDERLAYVTVEPGVTFRQLEDFLRQRSSRLFLGAPGSTPDASVVGNTVERGVVQGPQPDRSRHLCGLEVVLASGECLRTGMAGLPGSQAAAVHPWGLGPALDGLFLQSNLGIVTRMTLWLQPLPAYHQHLSFCVKDDDGLPGVLEALQRLRLEETITTSIGLHNADKIISLMGQYPYARARGQTPLPDPLRRELIDEVGGGRWFGEAAIQAATSEGLTSHRQRLESLLDPRVDDLSWSEVNAAGPFFSGVTDSGLAHAYWRKSTPPPTDMDLDRDRCGVIWHAPVVPFEAATLGRCVQLIERLLPDHGFEPILSLQAINARCVYVVVSILYDREVPGEDRRAIDGYRALSATLTRQGFYPYRLGLLGLEQPLPQDASTRALLRTLKRTFDPNHILAPGRYDVDAHGDPKEDPSI